MLGKKNSENACPAKNEKMKKAHFLRELEQIKLQKHTLERERIIYMYEKHDKQYSYLHNLEKTLNEEIKSEGLRIEQQLKKIRSKVNEFQHELKNVKPTPQFVEKLKLTMEVIESTINDFKQQQREVFENLMISEKETEQEIAALEGKIEALKGGGGTLSHVTRTIKPQSKMHVSNLPKEVKQFEIYVAKTGGMQGGWDDYDHGTFLRIREKFQGRNAFIQAAVKQIPGRSEKDIVEHEDWYSTFLDLKNKKKEAIMLWRQEKAEKENVDAKNEEIEKTKQVQKEDEVIQKRLQEEREAKRQELMLWKAEKQKELKLEEEKKLLEEKHRQAVEQRKRKEREAARRIARELLKQRKEEEERMQWMRELEEDQLKMERQQEVRERIAQFQHRDQAVLNFKQVEQQRKLEAEKEKKAKLEKTKLKVSVEKDPSRLYQLTEGWVHRTNNQSDDNKSIPCLRMPHRAIPSWRQNL